METYKIQVAVIECNEDRKEGKTRYAFDMALKSNDWFEVNKEFYGILHRAGTSVITRLALKAGMVYIKISMIRSFEYPEYKMCRPDGTTENAKGTEATEYFYIDIEA